MRPPRHILLVGKESDELGIMRYVLRNSQLDKYRCFPKVDWTPSAFRALHYLDRKYNLVIVVRPLRDYQLVVDKALKLKVPVILVAAWLVPKLGKYHEITVYMRSMGDFLERVRKETTVHRGLVKGSPAALRVADSVRNRNKTVLSAKIGRERRAA